jgi:tRNA(Ile)-lysidine synthase
MSQLPADGTLETAVRRAIESAGGWPASILVAVSGGLDSTVLLDVLARSTPPGVRLGAAHLDHGWRGVEGRRDASLVERLCRRSDVPFHRGSVAAAAPSGREAAARVARYAFLAGVARRRGYVCVVTGHTLDDQLETQLLRLQRGGRPEGLAGVLAETRLHGVRVLRPLLDVPRAAVEVWAEARSIPFREDETNADPGFTRNRLRQIALPLLPRAEAVLLVRLAALRRRLLEGAASRAESALLRTQAGAARLSAARLAALAPALRRELLRRAFRAVTPSGTVLGERSLDQVERLLASRSEGETTLRGARAFVARGLVVLEAAPVKARS